jgi:hypothetical protein
LTWQIGVGDNPYGPKLVVLTVLSLRLALNPERLHFFDTKTEAAI